MLTAKRTRGKGGLDKVVDAPTTEAANRSNQDADAASSDGLSALEARTADKAKAIDAEIRRVLRQPSLSLRDLSACSGLSIGCLSLVQRGRYTLLLTSSYTVATTPRRRELLRDRGPGTPPRSGRTASMSSRPCGTRAATIPERGWKRRGWLLLRPRGDAVQI